MEKGDNFFVWAIKSLAADGVGNWVAKNLDTLAICFVAAFGMTAVAAFHRRSDRPTFFASMLATFLLVGMVLWLVDDFGIRKVWWPLISAAIGGASLVICGAYFRFIERAAARLPDAAADAFVNRVTNAIDPKSPTGSP